MARTCRQFPIAPSLDWASGNGSRDQHLGFPGEVTMLSDMSAVRTRRLGRTLIFHLPAASGPEAGTTSVPLKVPVVQPIRLIRMTTAVVRRSSKVRGPMRLKGEPRRADPPLGSISYRFYDPR